MKYYHVPLMAQMTSRAIRCLYNLLRIARDVPDMLDDRDFETLNILSKLPVMDLETMYANTEVSDIPIHQQETLERFFASKTRTFSSRIEGIVKRQLHHSLQGCLDLIGRKLQVPEEPLHMILSNCDIQLPTLPSRTPVVHEFTSDCEDLDIDNGSKERSQSALDDLDKEPIQEM